MKEEFKEIRKLPTHIPTFDHIANGGLPAGRATMVAGSAGSGKTVFAVQYLSGGIERDGESAVFVTFEETPQAIRENVRGLGWDIEAWEREGKWRFVDVSQAVSGDEETSGEYDLGALEVRIEHAVKETRASRISIDSLGRLFADYDSPAMVRRELYRLNALLKRLQITAVITAERTEEYGGVSRYGIEEFVADNVIILRNVLEKGTRARTLEILKLRGASHIKGEIPYTIMPGYGIVVVALSALEMQQKAGTTRVTTGNDRLDEICGGGFFEGSVVMLTGPTGTGKSLAVTQFIAGGLDNGEKCLLLGFEESRDQLLRNTGNWGYDFAGAERDGLLRILCEYPESSTLEDHLGIIKAEMDEFNPQRVAIDSLSALDRVATDRGFREFVIGLTCFIRESDATGMYTAASPSMTGGHDDTLGHISTITDTIILLRYVEIEAEIRRAITVLKMRGSEHEKVVREFEIDSGGMKIGEPFEKDLNLFDTFRGFLS